MGSEGRDQLGERRHERLNTITTQCTQLFQRGNELSDKTCEHFERFPTESLPRPPFPPRIPLRSDRRQGWQVSDPRKKVALVGTSGL